jgi:hypothetical protein
LLALDLVHSITQSMELQIHITTVYKLPLHTRNPRQSKALSSLPFSECRSRYCSLFRFPRQPAAPAQAEDPAMIEVRAALQRRYHGYING